MLENLIPFCMLANCNNATVYWLICGRGVVEFYMAFIDKKRVYVLHVSTFFPIF